MTILHTYTDYGWMMGVVLFISLVLAVTLYCVVLSFKDGAIFAGVICVCVAGGLGIVIDSILTEGPDTYHKVIIDDYNDVYKQGFRIVDQEGEIYTVKDVNEYDDN